MQSEDSTDPSPSQLARIERRELPPAVLARAPEAGPLAPHGKASPTQAASPTEAASPIEAASPTEAASAAATALPPLRAPP